MIAAANDVDVSVVIVNWNTKDLLADCLQSIATHLLNDQELHSEVIVVDNGSADGSQEMVRANFPAIKLMCSTRNEGFARANNRGIDKSVGQYVLLLNSDARLVPEAIQRMSRALERDATLGIVGVCLAFPNGAPQFCYGPFPSLRTEFRSLFGLHRWDLSKWNKLNEPYDVDWVSGACLMARREMLNEVGKLDERFFFFGEEVDLCRRCKTAGWRVCVVPSPPVVHVRAGSSGKTGERFLRLFRGKMLYADKYWDRPRRSVLQVMIVLSSVSKLAIFSLLAPFSDKLRRRRLLWVEVVSRLAIEGL